MRGREWKHKCWQGKGEAGWGGSEGGDRKWGGQLLHWTSLLVFEEKDRQAERREEITGRERTDWLSKWGFVRWDKERTGLSKTRMCLWGKFYIFKKEKKDLLQISHRQSSNNVWRDRKWLPLCCQSTEGVTTYTHHRGINTPSFTTSDDVFISCLLPWPLSAALFKLEEPVLHFQGFVLLSLSAWCKAHLSSFPSAKCHSHTQRKWMSDPEKNVIQCNISASQAHTCKNICSLLALGRAQPAL